MDLLEWKTKNQETHNKKITKEKKKKKKKKIEEERPENNLTKMNPRNNQPPGARASQPLSHPRATETALSFFPALFFSVLIFSRSLTNRKQQQTLKQQPTKTT